MSASLSGNPVFFFRDPDTDLPLVGGQVFTYIAGTTTPQQTWADAGKVAALTNPIILDAAGSAIIYLDGSYKFIIQRADGTLVRTVDNIVSQDGGGGSVNGLFNGIEATYTVDHTVTLLEIGKTLLANRPSTITFSLPAAATAGPTFAFIAKNIGTGPLIIDPNLTEQIDGLGSLVIPPGQSAAIICNGSSWRSYFTGWDDIVIQLAPAKTALVDADVFGFLDSAASIALSVAKVTWANIKATMLAYLQPLFDLRYAPLNGPQNYLTGLTLSNDATTPASKIDIAIGQAMDSTNANLMTLAAALVKDISVPWVVGSGNGALDTGSIANATYHVFMIKRLDTGVVDVLVSLSATAPTMPTNYTVFRRIGSIIRAAAAILLFIQDGDRFYWNSGTLSNDYSGGARTKAALTVNVPSGIRVEGLFQMAILTGAGSANSGGRFSLFDGVNTSLFKAFAMRTEAGDAIDAETVLAQFTNTSAQIQMSLVAISSLGTCTLATVGYIDGRGK